MGSYWRGVLILEGGIYVQVSMGPEDVSLFERCPHFRGWYVHVCMLRCSDRHVLIPVIIFSI